MRYKILNDSEQETYKIGYQVGNRQIIIKDIEWESEEEHKIYRKGYMAGLMDYKRNNNVSNVSNVSKVNEVSNVDITTPITSNTPTTPISISKGNSNYIESNNKVNIPAWLLDLSGYDDLSSEQRFYYDNESIRQFLNKYWQGDLKVLPEIEKLYLELKKQQEKPKKQSLLPDDIGEFEPIRKQVEKWLDYKKARKETYRTEQSTMSCVKKLSKYSNNNPVKADEIIEDAMSRNYAGFFEPKNNFNNKPKNIYLEQDSDRTFLKSETNYGD